MSKEVTSPVFRQGLPRLANTDRPPGDGKTFPVIRGGWADFVATCYVSGLTERETERKELSTRTV